VVGRPLRARRARARERLAGLRQPGAARGAPAHPVVARTQARVPGGRHIG
jgi:hypothetical protein